MSKAVGLIPARMESSRLPRKPLKEILGMPMVVHVALRSMLSEEIDEVYVCTDSREIACACARYEIPVVLTRGSHQNGTERIAEAASFLELDKSTTVVDIQGDEPLVDPSSLDRLVKFFRDNTFDIVVPYNEIDDGHDQNRVKIIESGNRILYMSRAPVPHVFTSGGGFKKHLSTIAFSMDALLNFAQMERSKLEAIEGIELLRALEGGMNLGTFRERIETLAVDCEADLQRVLRLMSADKLFGSYQ